jgi:general secretion pathway protein D
LQKPVLQSSQNQPAHIFVGETRPIVTATQTGFTSGDTSIPVRSSIEQFDIGVTLDITPNITPGGLVELEVEQAVEQVSGTVRIDNNEQPIVARRELTSLVSVRDKGVVALGGLIRNEKTKEENKVPIIGDLPIFGLLFKQTKWVDNRTELIVFLKPTVLRTVDAAQTEAQKMRDKFKGLDNIPKEDLPPLLKEPTKEKKPWYAPFQPPKDQS